MVDSGEKNTTNTSQFLALSIKTAITHKISFT